MTCTGDTWRWRHTGKWWVDACIENADNLLAQLLKAGVLASLITNPGSTCLVDPDWWTRRRPQAPTVPPIVLINPRAMELVNISLICMPVDASEQISNNQISTRFLTAAWFIAINRTPKPKAAIRGKRTFNSGQNGAAQQTRQKTDADLIHHDNRQAHTECEHDQHYSHDRTTLVSPGYRHTKHSRTSTHLKGICTPTLVAKKT